MKNDLSPAGGKSGHGPLKWACLILGFCLPSAATWLYFYGGSGAIFTQVVYSFSKFFLILLPLIWILFLDRARLHWPRPKRQALIEGAISGLLIGVGLVLFYWFVLRGGASLAGTGAAIQEKIEAFGIGTPARFLGFAVFVVFMNASLEEYFWRGFIYKRLAEAWPWGIAVLVSGIGFSLHHLVVLSAYVPMLQAVIFAAGVGVGGMIWAWQMQRTQSIYSAWLSHAIIDVAVYVIGYDLIYGF